MRLVLRRTSSYKIRFSFYKIMLLFKDLSPYIAPNSTLNISNLVSAVGSLYPGIKQSKGEAHRSFPFNTENKNE